jgi:hypothetical protein
MVTKVTEGLGFRLCLIARAPHVAQVTNFSPHNIS